MSRNVVRQALTDRRELLTVGAAIAALVPVSGSAFAASRHSHAAKRKARTDKTFETAAVLRDLWIGHIFWVRAVSLATIEKHDAVAKTAEQQAVANAQSIAATIEPFYGAASEGRLLQAPRRALWCGKGLSCGDGRRRRYQAGHGNSVSDVERRRRLPAS